MKAIPHLNCLMLSLCMTSLLYGQDDHIIIADQIPSQALTDQTISQRL